MGEGRGGQKRAMGEEGIRLKYIIYKYENVNKPIALYS
jgi:hypothetical protein